MMTVTMSLWKRLHIATIIIFKDYLSNIFRKYLIVILSIIINTL